MRHRKINYKLLIVLVIFIAIGYAYLTRNLGNLGANLLRKNDWNIYFDNIRVLDGSITPTSPATIDNSKLVVNFSTSFNEPGEYYSFYVDVVNDGSVPCMINFINLNGVPSEYENLVNFTVKNFDMSEIREHQLLHAKDKIMLIVRVEYNEDLSEDDLLVSDLNLNLSLEFEYVQADETAQEGPVSIYSMMKNNSVMDNIRSEFVNNDNGINYTQFSPYNGTNGQGFYEYYKTANDDMPIYYYRGNNSNLIKFGGQCFNIIRTTDTGDVKLLYKGPVDSNDVCVNSQSTISATSTFTNYSYYRPLNGINYMYGVVESSNNTIGLQREQYMSAWNSYAYMGSYYYSDSITYDGRYYHLVNPTPTSNTSSADELIGKYLMTSGCSSTGTCSYVDVRYMVYNSGGEIYYLTLSNGQTIEDYKTPMYYGTGIIDNGDGTYTLENPFSLSRYDWILHAKEITNYAYTCNSGSTTCSSPRYIFNCNSYYYYYYNLNDGVLFGNDFEWIDNKYVLKDTTSLFDFNNEYSRLNNYHYTCSNTSGECTKLRYVYRASSYPNLTYSYLEFSNGKDVDDYIEEIFNPVNDSIAKTYIDNWYAANMLDYQKYIKDTVYCNDRSFPNDTNNVFNPNGGKITESFIFSGVSRLQSSDFILSCPNVRDSFTVSGEIGNGKLTYPVGLITMDEATLSSGGFINDFIYTMTPRSGGNGSNIISYSNLRINGQQPTKLNPVIAIDGNLVVNGGNGTPGNPYTLSLWY